MSRKKVSTTVYLDADHVFALKVLTRKTGVPNAEFVRRGVAAVIRAALEQRLLTPEEILDEERRMFEELRGRPSGSVTSLDNSLPPTFVGDAVVDQEPLPPLALEPKVLP